MARLCELPDQSPDCIRESAGLRERHDLGTQNTKLQWGHEVSLANANSIAKKLVRQLAECGTLSVATLVLEA